MENNKQRPTPAELLLQQLEKPLGTLTRANEVNNKAIELFTKGQLTIDQLAEFSASFAKSADALVDKILKTDPSKSQFPESKPMAVTVAQTLAQENRNRAITLTLEKQRQTQSTDRVIPLRPTDRKPPTPK